MFTMAKIRDGSTYLDNHLTKNDYYSKDEQVSGQWVGKIAHEWTLDQEQPIRAGDKVFDGLRRGVTPTGEKLTQRNGSDIKFYDFQCGAAKSVSIIAVMMGDTRLRDAHEKASRLAFSELERFASIRDRKGVKAWSEDNIVTGNLIAAKFTHDASRELDPQLHSHFVVANFTVGPDGKRYALDTKLMCQAIRYGGKVYQSEMAKACRDSGYETRDKTNRKGQIEGFDIAGVSDTLNERYSKRRAEVEAAIKKFREVKGREPSAAEISLLTKESRKDRYNMHEISTPEVRAKQLAQLSPKERESLEKLMASARKGGPLPSREGSSVEASRSAVNHIFERHSVAQKHEVLAESLNRGLGHVTLEDLGGTRSDLVSLRDGAELNEKFTTKDNLAREKWAVDHVDRSKGKRKQLAATTEPDEKLSKEQNEAVSFIGRSRDQVNLIRGVAGAGKTTTLKAIDIAIISGGHSTMYLAPTASAVQVLKTEGFSNATTVADYLTKAKAGTLTPEMKASLIIVDEAGLLSTKQGYEVLKTASKFGSRVLLVGDSKQHSAVEAGDFMRILENHSKISRHELLKIRRQRPETMYNAAVVDLSQGQAIRGLEKLDKLGWISETKDYQKAAAEKYLELDRTGKSVIGTAPTHAEGREITDHLREGMKNASRLQEEETVSVFDNFQLSEADKAKISTYHRGMVIAATGGRVGTLKPGETSIVESIEDGKLILSTGDKIDPKKFSGKMSVGEIRNLPIGQGEKLLVTANDKKSGLVNGDRLTFSGFDEDENLLTEKGKTIPKGFKHFSHGYFTTSHKSQGTTADHVIVAAQKMDSKAAYVSISRGRDRVDIFTPDKENLLRGLRNDNNRAAALDSFWSKRQMTLIDRVKLWRDHVRTRVSEVIKKVVPAGRPKAVERAAHHVPVASHHANSMRRGKDLDRAAQVQDKVTRREALEKQIAKTSQARDNRPQEIER